ncbi:MAG: hypothetical protein [Caudoviricetes sp.]|nr:MAG: hypothetical protein [Caudoviricetes sp.]
MNKEYLLLVDGKYELRRTDAPKDMDWIDIPEGAEIAVKFDRNPEEFVFYKDGGSSYANTLSKYSWKNDSLWKMSDLLNENFTIKGHDLSHKVLWTRYTQPEELPFTDNETDYLLSNDANRNHLMKSLNEANKATDDLFKACFEYADKIKCSDPSKMKEMRGEDEIKWAVDNSENIAADKINDLPDVDGPFKSDGGSSPYYFTKLPQHMIDDINETGGIEIKDIIRYCFDNDADCKDIIKALKRIHESKKGGGKEGVSAQYDANKVVYFANELKLSIDRGFTDERHSKSNS